jgi:hypothetical protein
MPQNDGFDTGAFEAHLNVIYHNRPTDIEPAGLDLFAAAQGQPPARQSAADPLRQSTDRNTAGAQPSQTAKPEATDASPVLVRQSDADKQAEAAGDRLAQEALLANPAEIRQLFPRLLSDASLNHNDHLDIAEINQALQQKSLPQNEIDALNVLKAGYKQFSPDLDGSTDPDGVSDASLAVLDKSMNRALKEDPIYAHEGKVNLLLGLGVGAALGAYMGRESVQISVLAAVAGAAVEGVAGEGIALWHKVGGHDDEKYDDVQKQYLSFVQGYEHPAASPAK